MGERRDKLCIGWCRLALLVVVAGLIGSSPCFAHFIGYEVIQKNYPSVVEALNSYPYWDAGLQLTFRNESGATPYLVEPIKITYTRDSSDPVAHLGEVVSIVKNELFNPEETWTGFYITTDAGYFASASDARDVFQSVSLNATSTAVTFSGGEVGRFPVADDRFSAKLDVIVPTNVLEFTLTYTPIPMNGETIPEPSAVVTLTGLLGMGLIGYCRRRRRAA